MRSCIKDFNINVLLVVNQWCCKYVFNSVNFSSVIQKYFLPKLYRDVSKKQKLVSVQINFTV